VAYKGRASGCFFYLFCEARFFNIEFPNTKYCDSSYKLNDCISRHQFHEPTTMHLLVTRLRYNQSRVSLTTD
jgi:hypothetical protein